MKNKLFYSFLFITYFLLQGCSEYVFNELNPVRLLCSGEFDAEENECKYKTDFPSADLSYYIKDYNNFFIRIS